MMVSSGVTDLSGGGGGHLCGDLQGLATEVAHWGRESMPPGLQRIMGGTHDAWVMCVITCFCSVSCIACVACVGVDLD